MLSSWWSKEETPEEAMQALKLSSPPEKMPAARSPSPRGRSTSDSIMVGDFQFEKRQTLDEKELVARSSSHLKVWGFSVACAVLYLPKEVSVSSAEDILSADMVKMLKVKYVRGVTGDQFRWVTKDSVEGNGFSEPDIATCVEEFNPLYKDVAYGDTYTMSYTPAAEDTSAKSSLHLNGTLLGTVSGRVLSKCIFSVWFGKRVWFESMREELLAGAFLPAAVE
eukprot:TRINITY_DN1661_c0_g1_i1.p1 TRINITY_DN1661_c0_g1~~TRINITY_DN1661_c0_g1_i1.p1  ORF type:complete len:223 (-),score=51.05 TRINITY_DN1661_c0_g1_i1:524-1192(-)